MNTLFTFRRSGLAVLFFLFSLIPLTAQELCSAAGGTLSLADGGDIAIICADDGQSDAFTPILTGENGDNFAWVITMANGTILAIPPGPPFNLEGAGAGYCFIYHIAYNDGFTGEVLEGANICQYTEDNGCFSISNHITVNRQTGEDCDDMVCDALSSTITFPDGTTNTSICVDGVADPLEVVMSGDFSGDNSTFIIASDDGTILDIPAGQGPFNLDGAGPGTCVIWYISYGNDLTGLTVGENVNGLAGCFDLSNGLVVLRQEADGGTVNTADGETEVIACAGEVIIDVRHQTTASALSYWYVITDAEDNILEAVNSFNNSTLDLSAAPPGECHIWGWSYRGEPTPLAGENISTLADGDCEAISDNFIRVVRLGADAGAIALDGGAVETTICVDDAGDPLSVIMSGDVAGDNSTFFITDNASGEILGVPGDNGPFDLNGAGVGVCDIWYLSSFGDVEGLAMGGNIADLDGCFDLSNPITVTRLATDGGAIALADGSTEVTICVDGEGDPLEVIRDGNSTGTNRTFVITNAISGEILGIPGTNGPFDLNGAGPGVCEIWYLAYEDGLNGLETGANIADLDGCFDLSNAITVTRNEPKAGEISLTDGSIATSICVDDLPDPLAVEMSGISLGDNTTFFITDANTGEILGIPGNNGPFDLNGAGQGICEIWYLSAFGEVSGLAMGGNIADLDGCFDLSNAITVTRNQAEAGAIALEGGETSTTICVDDMADPLTVTMSGDVVGDNSTFFITDNATGEILGVPENNGPFDLNGAGPGTCDIWYLSAYGEVSGLSMGGNIADLDGCFDLSNAITVTRNQAEAGAIAIEGGETSTTICIDDMADPLAVIMSGDVAGDNSTFFITDNATGEILGVPENNGPFDLNGAGPGTCDIWYLSAYGEVSGLTMGGNIADLDGCFDLSNAITVTRNQAEAGAIALEGGETSTTICVDDMADPLAVIMSGNVAGDNSTFFITDNATGEILGVPGNNGPFDLNGAGPGTCDIWYLSAFGEVSGLTMGGNIADLDGCFDLSNAITVTRNQAEAGAIALEDGETSTTICIEDMADPLAVIMSGNVAGDNSTFFITDNATGEILGVPGNNGPFDLNGAGPGTCDIWYLSAYGEVSGLSMGGNIADLDGCFDLSNAITVTRLAGEDCMAACEANGGGITLAEGAIGTTICVDGTGDPLEIIRDGNGVGTNRTFIITNAITGEILGIPDTNGPFDLDGAGPGTCDIWYLAYEDGLTGLAMGGNIADLDGCFDLSNAITVTRNQAEAGAIALEGGETSTTICVDDMADPLAVIMSGNVAGDNSTFFITDNATGEILGVPGNNGPFDLNGAGVGVCDIWYLSAYGEVSGLSMGGNIADLDGCFDLSNAITVTRNTGDDCGSGFTFDNVVLNEVTADGMIELFNGTDRQINVADFWLCNRPQYQQISNLQLECGNLLMEPGDITVVSGFSGFNSTDAELGLYTINSFGDTAAIVSYLEWGSSGHGRSGTAIQAGIWTANFFVSPPNANESLQLSVNGSSELEWNLAATSVCNPNNATTPTGGPSTEAQVSIFPNPVSGNRLNVMLEGMQGEMMQLQVFDMNGRQLQLLTSEMENGPVEIQLPAAPAGTYFLRVVNNGRVITERFTRF